MLLYHSKWIRDQKGSLMPITPQSEAVRELVRMQRHTDTEPLVGWFEIIRFPSSLSDAGFP